MEPDLEETIDRFMGGVDGLLSHLDHSGMNWMELRDAVLDFASPDGLAMLDEFLSWDWEKAIEKRGEPDER